MRVAVLAVGLLFVATPAVTTADECRRDGLTVEGTAEVRVKPDQVRIVIVAHERTLSQAQAEGVVRSATASIVALAREHGVDDADLDTSDYSAQPVFSWTNGRKLGRRIGFNVNQTVRVTLRDLSRFGSFLSRASETGGVSITQVEPEIDQTRQHRDEARLQAVRAAREKAQAIAADLGQSLGRVTTIEVDGASACCSAKPEAPSMSFSYAGSASANYSANAVATAAEQGEGGATYSLGAIVLKARVKVTFELK